MRGDYAASSEFMNLGIIIGTDGKINILKETLRVCAPLCKTIVVCDTGNWVINHDIKSTVLSYPNTKYVFPNYRTEFRLFDARVTMAENLPQGEWFLHMDGDERPSFGLLNDWKKLTDKLDSESIYVGVLPGVPHFGGVRLEPSIESLETCAEGKVFFSKAVIVKNQPPVQAVNHGNHSDWKSSDGRYHHVGHHFLDNRIYYYVHSKTYFQKINGHMMCGHNVYGVNWYIEPENEEWKSVVELNNKYGLKTSNDVSRYILEHDDYPDEILDRMFTLGCNSPQKSVAILFGTWALYIRRISDKITEEQYAEDSKKLVAHFSTNIHRSIDRIYPISFDQSLSFRDRYVSLLNEGTYCGHRCCTYGDIQL